MLMSLVLNIITLEESIIVRRNSNITKYFI